MRDVSKIVHRIIGPLERHCSAAGFQPTDCYVTAPLIGTGVVRMECSHAGSQLLDRIVAFDRAESSFANVTQTNMVAVSSFNGPQGILLGYDILRQPLHRHPLLNPEDFPDVYDAEPLFQATRALFGTVREKRFPISPGQHILCAYKTLFREGPCVLYGALAVAIAQDRERDADLFMEDHGTLVPSGTSEGYDLQEGMALSRLIDAVGRIGENLGVGYGRVLVGFRSCIVAEGEVGCVLTAAPYVHLARRAVPSGNPEALLEMNLPEWEDATRPYFLSSYECPCSSPSSTMSALPSLQPSGCSFG